MWKKLLGFSHDSTMPANAYNYQRVHTLALNYCWRRKCIFLIALISCVIVTVLFTRYPTVHEANIAERDTYLDDVSEDFYQTVLQTWYNFSTGEEWYNKKNISTLDPKAYHDLLTNIRQNWIMWNYNSNESYILQEPDVKDPSMGQSAVIREIFNDKKNGFFIECGAYDGETRSNTLFLERFKGWSGLLIEADPINFTKMLQKNRRAYLSPTCLSVIKSPTVASFLMARNIGHLHEPENTTENVPANTLDVAYMGEHIRVQCFPLILYIAALKVKTIDYFSLDIEGNEIDVLETIPFNEVDIKALSVEYIHNPKGQKYLIDMMEQRGYYVYSFVKQMDNLANDIIFVKRNTYRWIKNGKHYDWSTYDDRISQQPGRGTLVISRPRDEDLGQYQCFAQNEWGIATSNSVFVRKAELNSFKDENPLTLSATEGSPFKLTCQPPDGWPKPNVYWLIQDIAGGIKSINNSRMTLDPEGNLWFSNVTRIDASDDFFYACAATSVFRNEYKVGNKVLLNVISTGASAGQNKYPPEKQYVSRKNEVALRGKKIELYCIYGGTPLPQIVWSKNGKLISPSDRITQGNYGKSLVIKHVNFEDEGKYTCEASNGVGSAQSYSINLNVMAVPYFTVEPEFVNAAEDETVEIRCEASGVPAPEIKWIHNGKPISQAPPNSRRRVTSNSIVIEKLVKKDTGNYGCNATNSLGYVYKDVYVNVLALDPDITQPPTDMSTVDDKTVRITCRVFGAPKPEVKWIRNGQELTGGRYKILDTGDLEIENVIFADTGTYKCHASNKFGQVSASAELVVKQHTTITDEPEDYEVAAGSTATFRCNAVTDPSLPLTIDWLSNGEPLDFELEPRFVRSSDYSLMITKTTELDSGTYTCVAHTDLDEARAQATLIVQDVPNAPRLISIDCKTSEANVQWIPMGDNRAPILRYTIQYNTSFAPDVWEISKDYVAASEQRLSVPMSPWANYTFRVLAWNKIGPSLPSPHSEICTTPTDVPYKNPDNVIGKGTTPQNLVISWTTMPQLDHNAPRFMYRVYYRRDIPGEKWIIQDINDWKKNNLLVENQPTYQKYKIKVIAINEKGESKATADEVSGYSGEDVPLQAPGNFTLNQIKSSTTAQLSWSPVPEESVRGELQGYKIQTWTDKDGEKGMREIDIRGGNKTHALVTKFVPNSKNNVRILAYNGRYSGPPSETLTFDTPEGVPGSVLSLEAFPMGSSALFLVWTRPAEPNGILTGYRIYYQVVNGTKLGTLLERKPHVINPDATTAKLAGLAPDTIYRVHIRATTRIGEGNDYFIEQKTRTSQRPDVPQFTWETVPVENGYSNVRVIWLPNLNGNPGSHFFVKYNLKGETISLTTDPEFLSKSIEVRGLQSSEVYVMSIVAVDGDYMTESAPQEVETSSEGPIIQPKENVATAGWFIGMMLAIAILLLVLIIVCVIKRNRGGKYAVHERELAAGRGDYPEEGGFHEYSQPLDTKSAGGRASLASSSHQDGKHPESDTDSMAEYGDGDTEGMNEDGSFIGQYGRHRKQEPNSQAFATLV